MAKVVLPEYLKKKTSEQAIWHFAEGLVHFETGCGTPGTAADICANLNLGGNTDWFLPSLDELNLMYENLYLEGVGGFANVYYWSSSETDATHAWGRNFDYSNPGNNGKSAIIWVRAVRAF